MRRPEIRFDVGLPSQPGVVTHRGAEMQDSHQLLDFGKVNLDLQGLIEWELPEDSTSSHRENNLNNWFWPKINKKQTNIFKIYQSEAADHFWLSITKNWVDIRVNVKTSNGGWESIFRAIYFFFPTATWSDPKVFIGNLVSKFDSSHTKTSKSKKRQYCLGRNMKIYQMKIASHFRLAIVVITELSKTEKLVKPSKKTMPELKNKENNAEGEAVNAGSGLF